MFPSSPCFDRNLFRTHCSIFSPVLRHRRPDPLDLLDAHVDAGVEEGEGGQGEDAGYKKDAPVEVVRHVVLEEEQKN